MNNRRRILVVDDNPVNLEIVQEILDGDYAVHCASSAHEAIECAERICPRIILLDVMMPKVDGYELCRAFRQMPTTRDAYIIFLSAKAMPSEQNEGLQAGADAYLPRPFDDTDLLSTIRAAIDDLLEMEH